MVTPEAVLDAYQAPPPDLLEAEVRPAAEAPKNKGGRPRKVAATPEEAARLERERERKARAAGKAQVNDAKQAAEAAGPEPLRVPGAEAGGGGSMKLSKREAEALMAQVFSLPATILEPQVFGCLLVPGEIARVIVTKDHAFELMIPKHLEVTRKAAIEGIGVLLDGVEVDPRWVAAGAVAIHAISLGSVYWQIHEQMQAIRRELKAAAARSKAGNEGPPEAEQAAGPVVDVNL
jgi:hypothetical protein